MAFHVTAIFDFPSEQLIVANGLEHTLNLPPAGATAANKGPIAAEPPPSALHPKRE